MCWVVMLLLQVRINYYLDSNQIQNFCFLALLGTISKTLFRSQRRDFDPETATGPAVTLKFLKNSHTVFEFGRLLSASNWGMTLSPNF
jgi:hypothetical protein